MKRNMMGIRSMGMLTLLCLTSILLQLQCPTASALEATFTPNPADSIENGGDGGALPVSTQQRKQLLELEAAIINSQDPSATLNHVAQQNDMSQEELAGMLDRNRKDLQESGQYEGLAGEVSAAMQAQGGPGGGGGGSMASSLPRRIIGLITSIFVALLKMASVQISRNPKQSTVLFILAACTLLAVHNAPRNGIVISSGGTAFPPWSRGHTTVLEPPIDYLERFSVDSWEKGGWISSLPEPMEMKQPKKKSSKSKKQPTQKVGGVGMTRLLEVYTSNAQEGEVTVETSRKEEGFALVTTACMLLNIDEQDDTDDLQEEAQECMHESIQSILDERKFSEFVPDNNSQSLKFRSFLVTPELNDDGDVTEGAIMAMKLLGDFGRYGVQPMCISYEIDNGEEEEEEDGEPMIHCVAFHTLTGGHFDGELRFLVEETNDSSGAVAISVTLAIPKGGRAPPTTRLAEMMVSSLTQSIAKSSQIRTKQTLSRRRQSASYRAQASGRASTKRHLRYEQERAQEEMAADRKRKWKRNNRDGGRYRPTGCRSPTGGPKFGF